MKFSYFLFTLFFFLLSFNITTIECSEGQLTNQIGQSLTNPHPIFKRSLRKFRRSFRKRIGKATRKVLRQITINYYTSNKKINFDYKILFKKIFNKQFFNCEMLAI
ncbi:Hypothetical protein SRAE_2000082200 [Strongyloides ratti]|uniref:Uncharacterized protein n=1 Tax=Strongyloides ratti TaxID=34506 RepID=A0A090L8U3_STRRB|nr:Hypothetical protein SRAE_2000082200 [Strongyloides ratti]CEF66152.1 Hypothetical protein SRAE_2000082200 [Strongyloides ratti]